MKLKWGRKTKNWFTQKNTEINFFSWQILDLYQFVFPTLNKKKKKKPLQRLKGKAHLQEHILKIQESSAQIQPKLKLSLLIAANNPTSPKARSIEESDHCQSTKKKTITGKPKVLFKMIIICQNLRNNLQHPNEYIHGIIIC